MDNRVFPAPGELVSASGSNYHVQRFGKSGPLMILECGLTMMSACWGWIAPELAKFARVVRYDRAGLGWSDAREGVRDGSKIAEELMQLLDAMGVNEPAVLLGHSMGALFNRAMCRAKPGSARAMVWLDPAHPDQMKQRGIRRRIRHLVFYIEAARLLATKNVPAIEIPLLQRLDGLPPQEFRALRRFMRTPRHLQASAREARAWDSSAEFARDANAEITEIPLLIISARTHSMPGWQKLQEDLATLSRKCRHVTFSQMSHLSMLADREHAAKVAEEIRGFLAEHAL